MFFFSFVSIVLSSKIKYVSTKKYSRDKDIARREIPRMEHADAESRAWMLEIARKAAEIEARMAAEIQRSMKKYCKKHSQSTF